MSRVRQLAAATCSRESALPGVGRAVAAAILDGEGQFLPADGAQFARQVRQVFHHHVDHLAVALHPAAAGDHTGG